MAEEKHYMASDHFELTGCETVDLYLMGYRAGYEACEHKHLRDRYNRVYSEMMQYEHQVIELEEKVKKLKKKLKGC